MCINAGVNDVFRLLSSLSNFRWFIKVAFVAVCGMQSGGPAPAQASLGGASSSSSSGGGGGVGGAGGGGSGLQGLTVEDFRVAAGRCSDGEGSPLEYRFRLLHGLTLPELVLMVGFLVLENRGQRPYTFESAFAEYLMRKRRNPGHNITSITKVRVRGGGGRGLNER